MLSKIKEKMIKNIFYWTTKRIRKTKPIDNFDMFSSVFLLSMVRSSDIDMLLLAIKSFVRFVPIKGVYIVADPDITEQDRSVLKQQLVNVEIIDADSLTHPDIPRGGTWERIYGIACKNASGYIIQVDADTITNKFPEQVVNCISNNRAFTLGTSTGQDFVTLAKAEEFALSLGNVSERHIQIQCEALLNSLPKNYRFYVRGCSGFAGFPMNSLSKEKLVEVSKFYKERLGVRWSEWGTEQFTSNLMVSNIENKEVLNVHDYNVPKDNYLTQTFNHFIGTVRFSNLKYLKNAYSFLSTQRK